MSERAHHADQLFEQSEERDVCQVSSQMHRQQSLFQAATFAQASGLSVPRLRIVTEPQKSSERRFSRVASGLRSIRWHRA